jgi:hypothetical protein
MVETVLPARMWTPFRWLVGSAWVGQPRGRSRAGRRDGVAPAAGPLLVTAQTSDPLLVALAGLLQRLPWLLFGLYAGVLAGCGRVGSLYSIGVYGGIVAGQALGGGIAKVWGITGPFWFAFAGSAVLLALLCGSWRIAHADEAALAA